MIARFTELLHVLNKGNNPTIIVGPLLSLTQLLNAWNNILSLFFLQLSKITICLLQFKGFNTLTTPMPVNNNFLYTNNSPQWKYVLIILWENTAPGTECLIIFLCREWSVADQRCILFSCSVLHFASITSTEIAKFYWQCQLLILASLLSSTWNYQILIFNINLMCKLEF